MIEDEMKERISARFRGWEIEAVPRERNACVRCVSRSPDGAIIKAFVHANEPKRCEVRGCIVVGYSAFVKVHNRSANAATWSESTKWDEHDPCEAMAQAMAHIVAVASAGVAKLETELARALGCEVAT